MTTFKQTITTSLSILLLCNVLTACQTTGIKPDDATIADNTTDKSVTTVDKTTAAISGGLLGGIVGNQFGSGSGKTLMTLAGAVGGAILGTQLIGYEDQTQSVSTQTDNGQIAQKVNPGLNNYCHKRIKYHKDVPVDVDVAYVRYKRTFGFMTKNEIIRSRGVDPDDAAGWVSQVDSGFRHVVEPGVHYHMKDSIDLDTGYYIGWLSLELEKAGKNKTRVYVNYCEGGTDGFEPKYSSVIRKKVNTGYL